MLLTFYEKNNIVPENGNGVIKPEITERGISAFIRYIKVYLIQVIYLKLK
jgi:hypothetical protein